ncbi:MAG: hypothetical protein GPJ54_10650 [Candidatus Heimdallarchaeota archaeon]|nr:hypothetical protein [Candidatus Heimdallarchaeota archaeon]
MIQFPQTSYMINLEFFDSFIKPSSVAIIGISRKRPSLGQMILDNLEFSGYKGQIYLINQNATEISGHSCYSSIADVKNKVELLIILVPAKFVLSVLEDAGTKGIKAITIVTAGFSEVSEKGKHIEAQMLQIAEKYGMRIIGPNSMGTFSQEAHISFSPIPIFKGDVSYLSQSGSILVVAMENMLPYKIGFSKFISLGNKIDININHALNYLQFDGSTKVVNAYLESFSDPKNFRKIATSLTKMKPFVLVKGGKTEAGGRAAMSHTGALAGENRLITSVIESSGIIQADTIQEQVELSRFLIKYPNISSGGVAIVSSAGGPAILASDEIINNGLKLAKFTKTTITKLKEIIPPEGSVANPVDILAAANEEVHKDTIQILLDDTNVAAIILLIVHPVLITVESLLQTLTVFRNSEIPIVCCYLGPDASKYHEMTDLLLTSSSLSAIKMIKAGQFYSDWITNFEDYTNFSHLDNLKKVDHAVPLINLLKSYGFTMPKLLVSSNFNDIKKFIETNSPVVMKISHPKFSHKSDVGGIFLDIRNHEEMKRSWDAIQTIYQDHSVVPDERMIEVQEYISNGIEIALGIIYDQLFGHFVMIGSGGTLVELHGDVKFEPLPISRKTATKMIHDLKLKTLIDGFRGSKKIDENIVIDLILQLSKMVTQNPLMKELDLNPVILQPISGRITVVDARIEYMN